MLPEGLSRGRSTCVRNDASKTAVCVGTLVWSPQQHDSPRPYFEVPFSSCQWWSSAGLASPPQFHPPGGAKHFNMHLGSCNRSKMRFTVAPQAVQTDDCYIFEQSLFAPFCDLLLEFYPAPEPVRRKVFSARLGKTLRDHRVQQTSQWSSLLLCSCRDNNNTMSYMPHVDLWCMNDKVCMRIQLVSDMSPSFF